MMLTEKDEFIYHDMIVHVPMATNPKIKRVLVIGGGDGGTVRELTRYKTIEKIDMVDIDELVVRTCMKLLPFTACELDDPRVSLHFEDGLKFVRTVEEKSSAPAKGSSRKSSTATASRRSATTAYSSTSTRTPTTSPTPRR